LFCKEQLLWFLNVCSGGYEACGRVTPPLAAGFEKVSPLGESVGKALTDAGRMGYTSHKLVMGPKQQAGDLIPGTLDILILRALGSGSMHGYAIAEWIHERSHDVLRVDEGALYPALHRLELRGLLTAEWGASENNRRAKFYKLTAAGRKHLEIESQRWTRLSALA
jgi:PadR family transcriptional regulator PadR